MQTQIYVLIPEDDQYTPVQAELVGENLYKILPTSDYDPADAEWEFVPGTIEEREYHNKPYLQAIEQVG